MGMIGTWAGLAGTLPGLTNFFTQTPGLNSLLKAASGIAPERNMPRFARVPFQRQFMRRAARPTEGKGARNTVLLWPDTFNNFFHPETAMAAVEVLEHAGWRVELPSTRLCCGRPLYDFGMLDRAKRQLSDIIALLAPSVEAGIPLVGLEPACIAVFRDELINLFPNDKIARRLARQSFMLSEFLVRQSNYRPPPLKRSALIHVHCHQRSLIGVSDEIRLFELAGLDCDLLDSGCCGMAGSFGFDKEKYSVSQDIGELVLLPEVRAAASDTFIVSNGYSCREQIEQCTDRKTVHSAEVLLMAINLEKNAHSRVHHVEHLVQPAEIS
jgi:Fe-S oxidoreductase